MRPCFTFKAPTATRPTVLALDEEIGFWGTQAKDFRAALNAVQGDDLVVEINSPGGDVMAGLGMYNMLRNWAKDGKTVTTRVTALAGSIASIVALAGDTREMPKNTFVMVHSVLSGAWGTAEDLREAADMVDKVQGSVRSIYVDRMGVPEAKAVEIMAKDTWLTADECLELGFATVVTDAVEATAKFDVKKADLPAHVAKVFKAKVDDKGFRVHLVEAKKIVSVASQEDAEALVEATGADKASVLTPADEDPVFNTPEETSAVPDTPEADQIVAKAKAAGLEAYGAVFALACNSVAEAETRIASARNIVALCAAVGRPDDAKAAIKNNTPIAAVRAALVAAMAAADVHTDTTRKSGAPTPGQAGAVSAKAVYEKRAAARKRT